MRSEELEGIREYMGVTQEEMSHWLQCDYVGYKRWATGARKVPRYIERSALLLLFVFNEGKLEVFKKSLNGQPKFRELKS